MVMVMKNYFEIKIYQFSGLFYLVKMGQNFRARPLPLGKAMPERKPSNLRMRCSQSQAGFTLGEERERWASWTSLLKWDCKVFVQGGFGGSRRASHWEEEGGPSIGVGSPVCLHRGSKAGPGWTLGEADKALEEYGHCPKPPPTALDHFMEHPITIPPPPAHTSYRTFHGFRLWMFRAQTITYINIFLIIWRHCTPFMGPDLLSSRQQL